MNITLENVINRYKDKTPKPMGKHRFYSVLVPFVEKDGELNLLFELRSRKMNADPGEVCFPGGRVEEGEDFLCAALRETSEELGIPEDRIEIFGQGNVMYGYANYTLYSYLGVISYEDYLNATLSTGEVEKIFLVPLQMFFDNEPVVRNEAVELNISEDFPYGMLGMEDYNGWRVGRWEIPIYDIDYEIDQFGTKIWGLTGRIIRDIVKTMEE
ncbi:MAG: CoA pyrophosphatase [Eubacteriaceae bacterium]|nr:CoA pyrophosphatase [Eubacteriaceae bacterium]